MNCTRSMRPNPTTERSKRMRAKIMKYVSYLRVSTQRQAASGLGLDAQQAAVSAFCQPVEEYIECESGKRNDRPQLALALAACRRLKATLVVAKLDRLARNVAFVSVLMDSGVEFVACDNPHASRLTIHILAAVAEEERRLISERTRLALAAAKRRGMKLGNPKNLTTTASRKGRAANSSAAKTHNAKPREIAVALRDKGGTLQAIAETLTGKGILTRFGKAWTPTAVARLLA
jgi:DNA invertase Pin-like site-specific DNA recombinase